MPETQSDFLFKLKDQKSHVKWLKIKINKKLSYRWQAIADKPRDAGL